MRQKNEEPTPHHFDTFPSFIQGLAPREDEIRYSLGPYQVIRSLGKGGMGKVLLAYDTKCGRRVAIKKIRPDLLQHQQVHRRFLKEARITSQLTHPAIMPIYVIQDENDVVYYTMPFVQGDTLRQILRKTYKQEKMGEKLDHIGGSIPALIRIFISICQGVAYAHAQGVLHRDLKPENIMAGKYGEVLILDWGLAKIIQDVAAEEEIKTTDVDTSPELTQMGKVVGTINYMAPERARGGRATIQTEIYSLGVILYQILTLRHPFHRETLEKFLENMDKERIQDPIVCAPYRDIPRILSQVALKCLVRNPEQRYQTVDELIREIENYIEGRAEWFQIATLDINKKSDWEFQENVLIGEQMAITRNAEVSDWVSLMISKSSFTGNTKIEAIITIGQEGEGVGFLLSVPETAERVHLNDGYCLWLGSDINRSTKLLRSTVEVIHSPEIFLEREKPYRVCIEKIDHNIHFYLNGHLQYSYISSLPLIGTHVGVLSRDADFTLENFVVYVGSQNITVNCLAVPDAFLAHKDYQTALNEYRRIGYSFPGRAEGREAMFRAGITILEQARACQIPIEKENLYESAMQEFDKLHSTPGAPLEYLGKAHVYHATKDPVEEIKCYELAFRRYPNHPLLPVLQEQLIFRMHEVSRFHRKATYHFMLTAVKHLSNTSVSSYTKKLFNNVKKHWEALPFILEDPACEGSKTLSYQYFGILLAFWLANSYAIVEYIDELQQENEAYPITLANAFFCLTELGAWQLAEKKFEELPNTQQHLKEMERIRVAIHCHEASPHEALRMFFDGKTSSPDNEDDHLLLHIAETALDQKATATVHELINHDLMKHLPSDRQLHFDCCRLWAYLLDKNWEGAKTLLHRYPLIVRTQEHSLLSTLYGCWLAITEGKEIAMAHFTGVLEVSFPRSCTLLAHYLNGRLPEGGNWDQKTFLWEKRQLYRQLALFYHCLEETDRANEFHDSACRQYLPPNP
ncbi:MAG: serine/threonine-protein kinase PknD [Waddliaceae bacterium]